MEGLYSFNLTSSDIPYDVDHISLMWQLNENILLTHNKVIIFNLPF